MPEPAPQPAQSLSLHQGRIHLTLAWTRLGADLSVALYGGDRPHIGAVAVSQPRPSHQEGGGTSASTSVITLPGHKEDDLARAAAARLASCLGVTVSVACGIHLEAIEAAEIDLVRDMAGELVAQLAERLTAP
jgi:hypothetical protein